jgi:hypothetical protein
MEDKLERLERLVEMLIEEVQELKKLVVGRGLLKRKKSKSNELKLNSINELSINELNEVGQELRGLRSQSLFK